MANLDEKKKPRRRGRRGGKGRNKVPVSKLVVEQPLQIPQHGLDPMDSSDPYDDKKADLEIAKVAEEHKETLASADEVLSEILPELLRARDFPILDWICSTLGQTRSEVCRRILTEAIVRERVNYREAMGEGGASGKNIETLQERI